MPIKNLRLFIKARFVLCIIIVLSFITTLYLLKPYIRKGYFVLNLKNSNPKTRVTAVRELSAYQPTLKILFTIYQISENDPNVDVQVEASMVLDRLARRVSERDLLEILKNNKRFSAKFRAYVVRRQNIVDFYNKESFPELLYSLFECFEEDNAKLSGSIAIILVKSKDSKIIEKLKTYLKSNNWVRICAILEAFSFAGDKSILPFLLLYADSENDSVRISAISGIYLFLGAANLIVNENMIEKLLELLTDKNPKIRYLATASFSRAGVKSTRIENNLIRMLDDEDKHVQSAALEALSEISDEKSIKHFIKALKDKDQNVRWSSTIALSKVGNETVILLLITCLDSKNNTTYFKIISGLTKITKKPFIRYHNEGADRNILIKQIKKWWLENQHKYPKQILPEGLREEDIIEQFKEDIKQKRGKKGTLPFE